MSAFVARLRKTPVIAGAKDVQAVAQALEAGIGIIFFLTGTIFDLARATELVRPSAAMLFAHVDLLQGVGRDPAGIRWLGQELGIDGILSTRSNLIKAARDEGLHAIQRLFILDSEALRTGLKVVASTQPDAVELLPGLVVPNIQHRVPFASLPPVIAGGLVETEAEVRTILQTPAVSVSTSRAQLWRIFGQSRKTDGGGEI
ncbi:MAG: glycerol-3-phosphate responsive antiterminator [Limnochordales bacterium]|nr:glycerol-3-phosphate responsive antiterminator [Limnochordales bacterium]